MTEQKKELNNLYSLFTIGEIENPFTLKSVQDKTDSIFYVSISCAECRVEILYDDYKETDSYGEWLCEKCIIKTIDEEKEDRETMEDAR